MRTPPQGGKSPSPLLAFSLALALVPGCGSPTPGPTPAGVPAPVPAPPPPDPAAVPAAALRASLEAMGTRLGGKTLLLECLIRFPELRELAHWAATLADPAFAPLWAAHNDAVVAWLAGLAARPADFPRTPAELEAEIELFDLAVLQLPSFVLAGSHYPETTDFRNLLTAGVFDPTGLVSRLADLGVKVSEAAPGLAATGRRAVDATAGLPAALAWVHPLLDFNFKLARGVDPDAAAIATLARPFAGAAPLERYARLRVLGVPVLVPPMITSIDCARRKQVMVALAKELVPATAGLPPAVRVALYEECFLAACKAGRHCTWDAGTGDLDAFDGLLDRLDAEPPATRERMKVAAGACRDVVAWALGVPATAALAGRVERLASTARLPARK